MDDQVSKHTIFSGMFWRFLERVGAQGVTLLVSIVLARLLDPSLHGTIALVTVLITVLQVFVDSGMGNALIQKKDADNLDFSSVFYFNIAMCSILYILMFAAAPLIARFYNMPDLTPVIRVLSLTLIVSGVKNIQQAYVSRNLLFKKFFFSTLGGTIGAAVVGVYLAYRGYGIWALVAQYLLNTTVDTTILWITVKWRPKLMFSLRRIKVLFSYGWKLMVSSLIDRVFQEMRQLVIGKMYSPADLAFYNKGDQFPAAISTNINSSIESVLFPVLSKAQDEVQRVRDMTRRAIQISTFILGPLMIGLAACAEPFTRLLLTEKWLPCVPYLRIFCIVYVFQPIHTANLDAIKALGRSDLFLKLEIAKKVVGISVLLMTMWFGPMVMAYSLLFTCVMCQIINAWPNKKLLNYSYFDQLKDIMPSVLIALGMGISVYCVQFIGLNDWLTLLMQVPLGAILYVLASKLFRINTFRYTLDFAKGFLKRKA